MIGCKDRDQFLERSLSATEDADFRGHMETCEACCAAVAQWQSQRDQLNAGFRAVLPNADEEGARRLVAHAAQVRGSSGRSSRTIVWMPAVAVAAAVLLAVGIHALFFNQSEAPRSEAPSVLPSAKSVAGVQPPADHSNAPRQIEAGVSPHRERIGRVQFGLSAEGRLAVLSEGSKGISLGLARGTVALEVTPEKGAAEVTVRAGDYLVRVLGTRFWTTIDEDGVLEVGVTRGKVSVSRWLKSGEKELAVLSGGQKAKFVSGESHGDLLAVSDDDAKRVDALIDVAAPVVGAEDRNRSRQSSSSVIAAYDSDAVKQWILAGDYPRATAAIQGHLQTDPSDMDALDLLSTCHRKAGRFGDSVAVLSDMTRLGTPAQANRARYRSAVIQQDNLGNHPAAIALLTEYLRNPVALIPNALEARVRLSRSLKQVGNTVRCRAVLQQIVREHSGTEAAVQAGRELDAMR